MLFHTTRFSLRITSADTRRKKGNCKGCKIFFGSRHCTFFFGRTECELSYTNFPTSGVAEDMPRRFFHRSFRSLIETATFFYSNPHPPHSGPPCRPLRGFSDKERRGGDICHKGEAKKKKSDVDKRFEVRQTETNSRKQEPKEVERTREGHLVKHIRTYRRICLSYNTCMYKVSRAYFLSQIRDYITFH